jgi:protein-tyrosine-phosphatase
MFRPINRAFGGLLLSLALSPVALADADTRTTQPSTVVFVCQHGSVKSQMAAAYFNRIAQQRGVRAVAISRGIAVDPSIPLGIRQGLAGDGLTPVDDVPKELKGETASGAAKVIAFDAVPADRQGTAAITYWSDVPLATKDYAAARDAILRHVEDVIDTLAKR